MVDGEIIRKFNGTATPHGGRTGVTTGDGLTITHGHLGIGALR